MACKFDEYTADHFPNRVLVAALDRLGPVSYTHLRAHETVLDLVCRLLLEKKKHNVKTIICHNHTHTTYSNT